MEDGLGNRGPGSRQMPGSRGTGSRGPGGAGSSSAGSGGSGGDVSGEARPVSARSPMPGDRQSPVLGGSRTDNSDVGAGAGNPNVGATNPNVGANNPNAGASNPNVGAGNPNAGAGNPNVGSGRADASRGNGNPRGDSNPRSTTSNPSVRGSGGSGRGGFGSILGAFGLGALIGKFTGRGNSGNSGNNRGGSGDGKTLWQPWAFLALLILFGVFYQEKIPFVYDRSLEENMNQFLVGVEGTNKYPYEESRTGLDVYDKNRIMYNQMYEMGDKQYFVYVYSGDPERDAELNAAVELYEKRKGHLPVYKLKYVDLLESDDKELTLGDSKIFEMFRIDQRADLIGTYKTLDEWKVMWPDEKK